MYKMRLTELDINRYSDFLEKFENKLGFRSKLKWRTILSITSFHVIGTLWCYQYAFPAKWQTILFAWFMFIIGGMGITVGVHRLWTHRCYKVKQPLKVFLVCCFASAGQNSIYDWVRDHRLHHKFSDTEADPHNAKRGLFFSHIGWLMMKKNDLVLEKGNQMDMSDIQGDPLLMWEKRHSTKLSLLFCYLLPTMTGILLWGESWKCAVAWQCFIRFLLVLHSEMTVNSIAHAFGSRPYSKNIVPRQSVFVSTLTFGEGWHNYHHIFPGDYKASETFHVLDWSTWFIRKYQKLGWAYDLKEPSPELVRTVIERIRNETENTNVK